MRLNFLYLRNFRNFAELEIAFGPKRNVIFGENGQGKTNLLEAIVLLSIGRSFRTQHLSELIREKEAGFYLEAEFVREEIAHQVKLSFDGQSKKLQIDGNLYSHFNPLLGLLPSVLYAPRDGELISGSPASRRRFLDLHLAQSDPLYVHHLTRFYRAMKQRNCLLRLKHWDAIECWEVEMAQAATFIQQARRLLIESLQPFLEKEGKELSAGEELHQSTFHPSYPPESHHYLEQLKKNRKRDQELKSTSTGPHRDELSFTIDQKPTRIFGSEGQRRTALAALKLAEWRHLSDRIQAPPLMAVDDLGQPLDEKRETHFCQTIETLGQSFITTPKDLQLSEEAHSIEIRKGTCQKAFLK